MTDAWASAKVVQVLVRSSLQPRISTSVTQIATSVTPPPNPPMVSTVVTQLMIHSSPNATGVSTSLVQILASPVVDERSKWIPVEYLRRSDT